MDSKLNSKNSTLPFPVSSLTWDHFIYPRAGKSDKTISAYVEALAIGVQFPQIKIQRVFNYADGNETTDLPAGRHGAIIIIDGIHRSSLLRMCRITDIGSSTKSEKNKRVKSWL